MSYDSRYGTWLKAFLGKTVTADLAEMEKRDPELTWDPVWDEEKDVPTRAGIGSVNTNYRDYMPGATDERSGWSLESGLAFSVDAEGKLTRIEMTARAYGDDGLGDCDPDDEWRMSDYRCAKAFLTKITRREPGKKDK